MKVLHEQWGRVEKSVEVIRSSGEESLPRWWGPWKWLQGRGDEPAESICRRRGGGFGEVDGACKRDIIGRVCRGDKRFGDHRQRRWCTASVRGMCICLVGFGMGWSVGRSVEIAQGT